jgi:hypothetical protein
MAVGFMEHSRLVFRSGWEETGKRLIAWLTGEALLVFLTGLFAYVFSPGTRWERFLVAAGIPLAGLGAWVILLFLWKTILAPSGIHRRQTEAITELQSEIARLGKSTSHQMAEEDPKVYLDPLNIMFTSNGYLAFKVSNKGQRVNPAQGITVQIQCLPSVQFEYIDRLDPMEEKSLDPIVGDIDWPHRNILPLLRKAWVDAHKAGGFDDAEFPFEMTIRYRDAKHREFVTEVSLKYCPLEEDAAARSLKPSHIEYPILKVTNTEIRRLS